MLILIAILSSIILGLSGIVVGKNLVDYYRARGGPRRLLPAHIWGMAVSYVMLTWVAVPGVYFTPEIQSGIHVAGLLIGVVSLFQLVRYQRTYDASRTS